MAQEAAVSCSEVSFAYGRHTVLEGVDFSIASGDFVSMVGPNGGGKTTLLKLVLGLLQPDQGQVRVFGKSPARVRRRVGYMPQYVNLDPSFPVTVMDVVLMGRLGCHHGFGPFTRGDREAAADALAACEAIDLARRPFAALSGGQRQRVLIARALAGEPELLLLDEPTASLDPAVQDDLYDLLQKLNERMTLVLVSHDISTVSRYVNQVVCVNVAVAVHATTAISEELAQLFPGHAERRLVHHDHRDQGGRVQGKPHSGRPPTGGDPA